MQIHVMFALPFLEDFGLFRSIQLREGQDGRDATDIMAMVLVRVAVAAAWPRPTAVCTTRAVCTRTRPAAAWPLASIARKRRPAA